MAKLSAIDRQKQLVDLISHQGTMKITELATYFNVSRETIRRDLQELDNSGAVKKWYGAVMPVQDFNIPPVEQRMASFHEQKLAICKKALSYVSQRSTIFIDAGSTALTFASLLKETAGHTIITNSMPVVNELVTSQNHTHQCWRLGRSFDVCDNGHTNTRLHRKNQDGHGILRHIRLR